MNLLLIGPFPKPINGESLANNYLYETYLHYPNLKTERINTSLGEISSRQGSFSVGKLLKATLKYIHIYKIFLNSVVYITPGQTFLGVLKYAPFILVASALRKKTILHIHGGQLRFTLQESGFIKERLMKFVLRQAKFGIILSKSLRSNFQGIFNSDSIFEVHNFAEPNIFSIDFSDKKFSTLNVLYLGNLMIEKGIMELLDAIPLLDEKKIKVTIAGTIESNNYQAILGKIVATKANYIGPIYDKEKVALLEWSNLTILPTYYPTEGQPLTIIEGMVAGNYILATKHAGIPDIISNENGSFIKEKSEREIAEKLNELGDNMALVEIKARNNFLSSRSHYTVDRFAKEIYQILNL